MHRKKKILVVDDDQFHLSVILRFLKSTEHDITHCSDGLEAKTFLIRENYHIVLTDIVMPEVDGLELSNFIRESFGQDIYVIAMCAGSRAISQKSALNFAQFSVNAVLKKPFSKQELESEIDNAVNYIDALSRG